MNTGNNQNMLDEVYESAVLRVKTGKQRHRTIPNYMCCRGCWSLDVSQNVLMWQGKECGELWQSSGVEQLS